MVVQTGAVAPRLGSERDAVRRRPGLRHVLVERLAPTFERSKNTKLPTPRDLQVEPLRVAFPLEDRERFRSPSR
jgi:hypothetical protein